MPSADDATVTVCRTPDNCGEAPATEQSAYCASTLPSFDENTQTAACVNDMCVASDRLENIYVQILDGSTEAASCGSDNDDNSTGMMDVSDAGSDIMWVRLKSADGSVLAWGQADPDGSVHTTKWIGATRDGLTLNHPLGSAIADGVRYTARHPGIGPLLLLHAILAVSARPFSVTSVGGSTSSVPQISCTAKTMALAYSCTE